VKVNIENKAKGMNNSKMKSKIQKITTNYQNQDNMVAVLKEKDRIMLYDNNLNFINTLQSCKK